MEKKVFVYYPSDKKGNLLKGFCRSISYSIDSFKNDMKSYYNFGIKYCYINGIVECLTPLVWK